jgi:hypothetical protein
VLEVAPFTERFKWNLPALESLDWAPCIESEVDTGIFDSLWLEELPALRELTLRGWFVGTGILERPESLQFLRGLDRLTVPASALVDDRDALVPALLRNAGALAHLSRLAVTQFRADLPDDLAAALPNLEVQAGSSSR